MQHEGLLLTIIKHFKPEGFPFGPFRSPVDILGCQGYKTYSTIFPVVTVPLDGRGAAGPRTEIYLNFLYYMMLATASQGTWLLECRAK